VGNQIMLFRVGIFLCWREAGGEEDVLFLIGKTVRDPDRVPDRSSALREGQFFFEFAASQFFRIDIAHLPSALRELETALLDGVAKLLDQPDAAFAAIEVHGSRMMMAQSSLSTTL
jgi:hypothetical protein